MWIRYTKAFNTHWKDQGSRNLALKAQQHQILKAKATKALGTSLLIIPELHVLVLTKRHVGSGNEIDRPPFWKIMLGMRTCLPCHIPDRWSRGTNRIWPDLAFGFVHKRSGNQIRIKVLTFGKASNIGEVWNPACCHGSNC